MLDKSILANLGEYIEHHLKEGKEYITYQVSDLIEPIKVKSFVTNHRKPTFQFE